MRWVNIDLDNRVIYVRRQVQRVRGDLYEDDPKGRRRRPAPLPRICLVALRSVGQVADVVVAAENAVADEQRHSATLVDELDRAPPRGQFVAGDGRHTVARPPHLGRICHPSVS